MNIGAVSSEALGSDRGHRCELEGHRFEPYCGHLMLRP